MRDKQWREVLARHMKKFKVPQEDVEKFWSCLDYLESGGIKKYYERNKEEEAAFREADDYVNDMVYRLNDMSLGITKEEIESLK